MCMTRPAHIRQQNNLSELSALSNEKLELNLECHVTFRGQCEMGPMRK